MFKCQICGKTTQPRTPAHKVVVQTRRTSYPHRPKAFACWKQNGARRKFTRIDDPGGVGSQIAQEVIACPDCARKSAATGGWVKDSPRQIRSTQSELIEAYLNHVLTGSQKDEWAVSPVVMMTFSAPPEQQWDFILEMIEKAPDNDEVLSDLAAGPLEGLLGWHGEKVISWVEQQARDDPKFARTLTGVWQYMMPDDVWRRVQELQAAVTDPLFSRENGNVLIQ